MDAPVVVAPRLNAQRFLVTYAHTEDNAEFLGPSLAIFLKDFPFCQYVAVNREFHADGGQHWHAVLYFTRRYQGVVATCFDFLGQHPNIRTLRSRKHFFNCLDYIVKYGDAHHTTFGELPDADIGEEKRNAWADALRDSTSAVEFMGAIEIADPKSFVLRYFDILAFANNRWNAPSSYVPEYPRESYTVPAAADQWVADVLGEVGLCLSPRHRDALFLLSIEY